MIKRDGVKSLLNWISCHDCYKRKVGKIFLKKFEQELTSDAGLRPRFFSTTASSDMLLI